MPSGRARSGVRMGRRRALGRMAFVPWNRGRRVGRWRRRCGSSQRRRGSTSTRRSRRGARRRPQTEYRKNAIIAQLRCSALPATCFAFSTPRSPAGGLRSPTMPVSHDLGRRHRFPNTDRPRALPHMCTTGAARVRKHALRFRRAFVRCCHPLSLAVATLRCERGLGRRRVRPVRRRSRPICVAARASILGCRRGGRHVRRSAAQLRWRMVEGARPEVVPVRCGGESGSDAPPAQRAPCPT